MWQTALQRSSEGGSKKPPPEAAESARRGHERAPQAPQAPSLRREAPQVLDGRAVDGRQLELLLRK